MERTIKLARINPKLTIKEIGNFIVNKILNVNATGGVIGLSGGVDSTTTAAIANIAFNIYNQNNLGVSKGSKESERLELVGYIIPSKVNSKQDTEDGISVAEKLGIRYEVVNIEDLIESHRKTNPEAFIHNYDKGNLISRIRANVLSTKAATENKILIGTGNRDEDFGIGYYTLFGDGAVHISPIGCLSKRHVKEIASYLGFKDIATKEPTAGLEANQTDFKDLGYYYDLVELVIEGLNQGFLVSELKKHSQIISLGEKQISIYNQNFGHKKFTGIDKIVDDILYRHNIADGKSSILHPPIPKITMEY